MGRALAMIIWDILFSLHACDLKCETASMTSCSETFKNRKPWSGAVVIL